MISACEPIANCLATSQPLSLPLHHSQEVIILDEGRGCPLLTLAIQENPPQLHIFGHIHGDHGELQDDKLSTRFINVSSYEFVTS